MTNVIHGSLLPTIALLVDTLIVAPAAAAVSTPVTPQSVLGAVIEVRERRPGR